MTISIAEKKILECKAKISDIRRQQAETRRVVEMIIETLDNEILDLEKEVTELIRKLYK